MKLGYSGEKGEAEDEEEMTWAQEEDSLRWRKSVSSGSNRLIDKRQAITYETQVHTSRDHLKLSFFLGGKVSKFI